MSSYSPKYILAYMADGAGCGFHRIAQPVLHLIKNNYALGRCDFNIWPIENLQVLRPDVIVWQRQHEEFQIENIKRAREALPDAFFVYEIDDILSAVPEWSPHRHHIPYDVDTRMARAISFCDAATVTTRALANHLKAIVGDGLDVRIRPNMLSKDDLIKIDEAKNKSKGFRTKVRIGWGGGISHIGDLQYLYPAIKQFQDKVTWVFLGQGPELNIPFEFHPGVQPPEYLAKLASLDLDLMVAPLVDNVFNRCKSNLRILEGAACKYPVIASPVEPYLDGNPPVYSYAEPDQWVEKIGEFLESKPTTKGAELRQWLERHYVYENKLPELMKVWLPKSSKIFVPKRRSIVTDRFVFVTNDPLSVPTGYSHRSSFGEVAEDNGHVVYMRRGTHITKEQLGILTRHLVGNVAAICPLTNDGGFPRNGQFVGIDSEKSEIVDKACRRLYPDAAMQVPFCYGPVVVVSRKALDLCGMPDFSNPESIEAALTEWGVMATARGFHNLLCYGTYVDCPTPPVQVDLGAVSRQIQVRYNIQAPPDPLQEIRAHMELAFYRESYVTPMPSSNSSYEEWYSMYDTISDEDVAFLEEYAKDKQITIYQNDGITWEEPKTDWVIFAAKDSIVAPQAIYYFCEAAKETLAEIIYADNDFINEKGNRHNHDFKPIKFDYDLFLGRDYISQICAVRTVFLLGPGGFKTGDAITPEKIAATALKCYKSCGVAGFQHVSRILAHLPTPTVEQRKASAAAWRNAATKLLVADHDLVAVQPMPEFPQYNKVSYKGNVIGKEPKVSVIIPTKDRVEMISPCLESLMNFNTYKNFEVLVIDNGSTNPVHKDYLKKAQERYKDKVRVIEWNHKYNWAALNNWATQQAKGDFYLFLNDDTRLADPVDWLQEMVGAAMQPHVGAVCAKLLYPSGMIQHVGVVHNKGLCGHLHKGTPGNLEGYNGIAVMSHASSAVTGACMLISADLFRKVHGFDERFKHNFNDVAFCIELNRLGLVNLTVCTAIVQHLEGITRLSPATTDGGNIMRSESLLLQELYPETDEYWNPNLLFFHLMNGALVSGLNFDTLRWPPQKFAWRDAKREPERILLVGDDGQLWIQESQRGNICYAIMLSGYQAKIVRPGLDNVPVFDVRDGTMAMRILGSLGIERVTVRSILGGVAETLPFLSSLGFPIDYRPNSAEAVCPRITCQRDGADCEGGWKDINICKACMSEQGSPFGRTSVDAWRNYWNDFLDKAELIQTDDVPPNLLEPLKEVYKEVFNV